MDDTKKSFVAKANAEVARFMKLQVDSELNGRQMLQELFKVYPEGIPRVFNGIRILPREVAALIRDKSCHAVYFHPLKERWFFASKLHKEVAEARQCAVEKGILQLVRDVACVTVDFAAHNHEA